MAGTWALEESASASGREDVAEELASEHAVLSDSDAEDLIAMGPATMDSEIPRPPTLSGCGWWQDPLWRSLEAWRRKRPHSATQSMRHVAVCAGALTERYGFKVLWGCGVGRSESSSPSREQLLQLNVVFGHVLRAVLRLGRYITSLCFAQGPGRHRVLGLPGHGPSTGQALIGKGSQRRWAREFA